ncbi:MAG: DUF3017 domain-containing protein [Cellulomonadaceae bacterium]|nr:DUF3017 domain-containing protein [Cellulomonadaceae bacterium]
MTPEPSEERHRAPALWLVATALAVATLVGGLSGARAGVAVLVATLVVAAASRLVLRGRRPEGVAVRSVWLDATILLGLAVGCGVLMFTTGV